MSFDNQGKRVGKRPKVTRKRQANRLNSEPAQMETKVRKRKASLKRYECS